MYRPFPGEPDRRQEDETVFESAGTRLTDTPLVSRDGDEPRSPEPGVPLDEFIGDGARSPDPLARESLVPPPPGLDPDEPIKDEPVKQEPAGPDEPARGAVVPRVPVFRLAEPRESLERVADDADDTHRFSSPKEEPQDLSSLRTERNTELLHAYRDQHAQLSEAHATIRHLTDKIGESQDHVNRLLEENARLSNAVGSADSYEQLREDNLRLLDELELLTVKKQSLESDNQKLLDNVMDLELQAGGEHTVLLNELKDLRQNLAIRDATIAELNESGRRVELLDEEIESLKRVVEEETTARERADREHDEYFEKVQADREWYDDRIRELEEQLQESLVNADTDRLNAKINELEYEIEQLEKSLTTSHQENEELNQRVAVLSSQLKFERASPNPYSPNYVGHVVAETTRACTEPEPPSTVAATARTPPPAASLPVSRIAGLPGGFVSRDHNELVLNWDATFVMYEEDEMPPPLRPLSKFMLPKCTIDFSLDQWKRIRAHASWQNQCKSYAAGSLPLLASRMLNKLFEWAACEHQRWLNATEEDQVDIVPLKALTAAGIETIPTFTVLDYQVFLGYLPTLMTVLPQTIIDAAEQIARDGADRLGHSGITHPVDCLFVLRKMLFPSLSHLQAELKERLTPKPFVAPKREELIGWLTDYMICVKDLMALGILRKEYDWTPYYEVLEKAIANIGGDFLHELRNWLPNNRVPKGHLDYSHFEKHHRKYLELATLKLSKITLASQQKSLVESLKQKPAAKPAAKAKAKAAPAPSAERALPAGEPAAPEKGKGKRKGKGKGKGNNNAQGKNANASASNALWKLDLKPDLKATWQLHIKGLDQTKKLDANSLSQMVSTCKAVDTIAIRVPGVGLSDTEPHRGYAYLHYQSKAKAEAAQKVFATQYPKLTLAVKEIPEYKPRPQPPDPGKGPAGGP